MKDKTKNTPQVLLRRALLVLMDAAIVAFSFYFALLLRADGAVEAVWWPHNRALLYENLPWIVAVYIVCFLAGGLYSVLWKYAGERDLIRLAGMIAVPTAVVYVVNRHFIHGVLFNSANCMASVLIFLFIGGSRLAWRLFLNHPLGEQLRKVPAKDPTRPVMIVGAGAAGAGHGAGGAPCSPLGAFAEGSLPELVMKNGYPVSASGSGWSYDDNTQTLTLTSGTFDFSYINPQGKTPGTPTTTPVACAIKIEPDATITGGTFNETVENRT